MAPIMAFNRTGLTSNKKMLIISPHDKWCFCNWAWACPKWLHHLCALHVGGQPFRNGMVQVGTMPPCISLEKKGCEWYNKGNYSKKYWETKQISIKSLLQTSSFIILQEPDFIYINFIISVLQGFNSKFVCNIWWF